MFNKITALPIKPTKVVIPREVKLKKFKDKPPHSIFYDENTIKWFKKRYPENIIKKSIYSLLPNNGEQMLKEEPTQLNIIMKWLETYCKPKDKYQNLCINPKYFFSKEIYNKILKLKEIFLQFDEDGSRKMEIDEMVTMFQTNHIEVNEDELCSLFFKGKTYRKQDIDKLYLDFYQFMQFALNKKSDQDFRVFMRRIKEKIMKEKKEKIMKDKEKEDIRQIKESQQEEYNKGNDFNSNIDNSNGYSNKILVEEYNNDNNDNNILNNDEKNEPIFLPMNFNLVLDYFINKGKERKSQKKIRRAIKLMKNILNPGTFPPDDKDFLTEDDEGGDDDNTNNGNRNNNGTNAGNSNINSNTGTEEHIKDKDKEENEYAMQLKEINTENLMEEFSKLFQMSYTTNQDIQKNKLDKQKNKQLFKCVTINPIKKPLLTSCNDQVNESRGNRYGKRYSTQVFTEPQFMFNEKQRKKKEKKMIFTDMIKNSLYNKTETEMNMINYNRYKSVKLAKEETARYFSKTKRQIRNNSNYPSNAMKQAHNAIANTELNTTTYRNNIVQLPVIEGYTKKVNINMPIKPKKNLYDKYLFTQ